MFAKVIAKKLPKSALKPPSGFKKPRVQDFKKDMEKLGERIAEGFKKQLIKNIETNAYGFKLAQSTIQRKGHSIPLIETEQLIEAIYRDGTEVSVDDTPRDDGRLTNLELAIIHEYGTKDKHIPARPVWRNTFRDYRKTADKKIKSFYEKQKRKK